MATYSTLTVVTGIVHNSSHKIHFIFGLNPNHRVNQSPGKGSGATQLLAKGAPGPENPLEDIKNRAAGPKRLCSKPSSLGPH